jgi:hypothetical protein
MGMQLSVRYNNLPITYDVTPQESNIYILKLDEGASEVNGAYVPQKMVIRRKGKIWISDLENYHELVNTLMEEIDKFSSDTPNTDMLSYKTGTIY